MKKMTKIAIYDTTLRDGSQAESVSLSLEDKLLIAERLDLLGIDYIEGGYPLSNPKDEAFFKEIRKRKLHHAKIAAFGMTRRKGFKAKDDEGMKALLRSQAPVITIVGKSWDMHVKEVLRTSLTENLDMIFESLQLMVREGREVIFDAEHFFDGYRANPEYAIKTLESAAQAGATTLVLCDTNGGSLPTEPHAQVRIRLHQARRPETIDRSKPIRQRDSQSFSPSKSALRWYSSICT